jgi:Ca2+-binding EF-hand superfamily protein
VDSYAPNIIQRMTKIFSLATEKGLSFQDIFSELDEDKDGKLDAVELRKGLQNLGTFGEVSVEDAEAVVKQFDHKGDRTISLEEFIDFFSQRVKQVAADRVLKKRSLLINKFLEVLEIAEEKGVTLETIFEHFDRDKSGSLTMSELASGLRSIPHFKALTDGDIQGLVEVLDSDRNGDVSLKELKAFVAKNTPPPSNPTGNAGSDADLTARMKAMMSKAEEKGHTLEDAMDRLDSDGRGRVSCADMISSLIRLPHFRDAMDGDVKRLVTLLDTDRTGYVQLQNFKTLFQVPGQGPGQGQLVSRAPDRVRRPADSYEHCCNN